MALGKLLGEDIAEVVTKVEVGQSDAQTHDLVRANGQDETAN